MANKFLKGPFYMGFDLSTQQLKAIVVKSDLKLIYEAKVDFDADLSKYGIHKGVLSNPKEGEIYAPIAMFLEAVELILLRLKANGLDFSLVKGMSGAGMQHGTVFWSRKAEHLLKNLDPAKTLVEQLGDNTQEECGRAFSHPFSPNWQDSSTQKQCEVFDKQLGGPEELANITGSKAHHRFSGPQILRFHQKYPRAYDSTSRISLVSSFLASIFLGKIAPIDISDAGGMNLWDIQKHEWNKDLVALAAGEQGVDDLLKKLAPVAVDGGEILGRISTYFVSRFGFPPDCAIIPFTGDNPSTILSLPLRASDAIVSLGTSTTFLMSTNIYKPDPVYHLMNHPTMPGLYMFMLCYKNGSLAREQVRDAVNDQYPDMKGSKSWEPYNTIATQIPPLGQTGDRDVMRLGLYFPQPEIVPNVRAGHWRFLYDPEEEKLKEVQPSSAKDAIWHSPWVDARAIVESQYLSCRLRSQHLAEPQPYPDPTKAHKRHLLPPQPRRIYLVGGGSVNPALQQLCGEVLGGAEGIFQLDIGSNACALGSAYKAAWGVERGDKETFEALIEKRWDESNFVKRVAGGYREGIFEQYGDALKGLGLVEKAVLEKEVVQTRDPGIGAK